MAERGAIGAIDADKDVAAFSLLEPRSRFQRTMLERRMRLLAC